MTSAAVLPNNASLTLHTLNENDLVDAAVAAFKVNVPEWVEQEGAVEVTLIESLALMLGQQVYALNQLPKVVLDALIGVRGITRHPAIPANGAIDVTLAVSTVGTRTVPAGCRFRITSDGTQVDLLAVDDVQINPTDSLTGTVTVTAATAGAAANGIPNGTAVSVVDALAWVESAVVSTPIAGGSDVESDDAFYTRAAGIMQRDHGALVMDSQFANAALDVLGVGRAAAWGLWDSTGSPGSDAGHVTVAVCAPDGTNVSSDIKTAVGAALSANAVAGLTIHVIDFTQVTMTLTLTYVLAAGYDATTVTAAIRATLLAWLNPATWPLGQTLTHDNQIVLHIGQVPGVTDVTALTGRQDVTGTASLPSLTSVTITQT